MVSAGASTIEYLDYPKFTQSGDEWYGQMYMPARAQQTDGYPAFDRPGVIKGYYVASYIPQAEQLSMSKSEQLIVIDDGATSVTTYAAAILAAVTALMF